MKGEMPKIYNQVMDIQRPESSQPIPPHAKRVFKGVLFDVYQWEQELFDGTTTVFEKIKRADTVVVFSATQDKRIIIVKEQQPGEKPFVSLPGGRIDEGENPLAAAKRELLEETGYASNRWSLWDARHIGSKIDWANYLFLAKDCVKSAQSIVDAGEKISLCLVSFDEFIDIAKDERFRNIEVALALFRAVGDKRKFEELRTFLME
ncbi:MAG: NUDIX hydrolase [Candidatus Wildermuthbacteria bacterium]|nr:NUDIX hydrolase [Candidatus Wildermuthbacteria bacterium]